MIYAALVALTLGASSLAAQPEAPPVALDEVLAPSARPTRPQTPRRPFPYDEREVVIERETSSGGVKLAGTLSVPREVGLAARLPAEQATDGSAAIEVGLAFPAVILITGSGQQDRDETIMGHKPFLVLSDYLTRRGVAVLRLDDRGAGASTGEVLRATTFDFADDIGAALGWLREQPEIDWKRIGLIGHSEGGVIAPIVAAGAPEGVAFMVLLAGTGVNGAEVLEVQMRTLFKGTMAKKLHERFTREAKSLLVRSADASLTDEERLGAITRLVTFQLGIDPDAEHKPGQKRRIDAGVKAGLAQLGSPWIRAFVRLEPREHLAKVKCPVLVLNGSKDLQVDAAQNVPAITKALLEAGNADVTAIVLPGLNHLFQPAKTGGIAEYGFITTTFDESALQAVGDWVVGKVKPTETRP